MADQLANPIKISEIGCLLVRPIEPKKCYKPGEYKKPINMNGK